MENLLIAVIVMGGLLGFLLIRVWEVATDIKQELKGLRFQLQETFTPEEPEKGHSGHLSTTRYLVGKILQELQKEKGR